VDAASSLRSTPLHTEASGVPHPDAFGSFRVLHQIGAGALGPVFRAYDPERDRLAAVKWFRLDLPPDRVHRLLAELERLVAADLNHPAIATPLATGISGAWPYLAQEFVAADSLDVVLRENGPAPPSQAVRTATQLAGALDFAAAGGFLHGALHPRDVLLSADLPRLTGLGIAAALDRVGVPGPVRRPYAAPERAQGGAWDRRADVFGLAALVYELLSGRRLAAGRDAADAVSEFDHVNRAALKDVFSRALADDPDARFGLALEFVDALRAALVERAALEPVAPAPPPGLFEAAPDVTASDLRLPLEDPLASTLADAGPPATVEPIFVEAVAAIPVATAPPAAVDVADVRFRPAPPPAAVDEVRPMPVASPRPIKPSAPASGSGWKLVAALVAGLALGYALRDAADPREPDASSGRAQPAGAGVPAGSTAHAMPASGETSTAPREFTERPIAPPPADVPPAPGAAAPRAPSQAPAPAANGRLLIRSTPSGARVVLDGRNVGTTPVTVRDLAAGTHTVRVERGGYGSEQRRVSITADRPAQSMLVELTPTRRAAPQSGRYIAPLFVDSRPSGARVFLNGKPIGTTPLAMSEVPAGEHAVRLELDGYSRWTSSVRVVAGERNRVTASLERQP
jgi:serine/threonine-protein kinase